MTVSLADSNQRFRCVLEHGVELVDDAHCTDVLAASFKVRDRSQLKVQLNSVLTQSVL